MTDQEKVSLEEVSFEIAKKQIKYTKLKYDLSSLTKTSIPFGFVAIISIGSLKGYTLVEACFYSGLLFILLNVAYVIYSFFGDVELRLTKEKLSFYKKDSCLSEFSTSEFVSYSVNRKGKFDHFLITLTNGGCISFMSPNVWTEHVAEKLSEIGVDVKNQS